MIYTIHMKSDAKVLVGDTSGISLFDSMKAVPEKNAPWALAFPPFWLAYYRLWFALLVYCLIVVLALTLLSTVLALSVLLLMWLPGFYLLFEGNQLRRNKLETSGYDVVDVVYAPNEEFALKRFLSNWRPKQQVAKVNTNLQNTTSNKPSFGMFPQGEL